MRGRYRSLIPLLLAALLVLALNCLPAPTPAVEQATPTPTLPVVVLPTVEAPTATVVLTATPEPTEALLVLPPTLTPTSTPEPTATPTPRPPAVPVQKG